MQGLICPAPCKTEPLRALNSLQKGTSISPSAVPHSAKKRKFDGEFGKSRMHPKREISMVEFLAAGETRKA